MKRLDPRCDAALDLASGRYTIRTMRLADMQAVPIPWMRDAGWNPGLHDAECFLAADREGFLLGELDGEPVACVSAVRYEGGHGFFGCYIVAPAMRGRGYGLAIEEAGARRLAGCTNGADGVLENEALYRQIGFARAWRNARYEGARPARWSEPAYEGRIADALSLPFAALAALDRRCFPAPREAFLRAWLAQPEAHALAALGRDGELRGYAVARRCHRGWKIGPLFARDEQAAEALHGALVARFAPGEAYVLDVPDANPAALRLAARHGLRETFATARMYDGPPPALHLDEVYGITTFELG